MMREVQASDAKTHLPQLLDEVERGEVILITRHGRPVARLVPEAIRRKDEIRTTFAAMRALRKAAPPVSAEEIRSMIDEGRKY